MGFFDTIKGSIKNQIDRRKEEREHMQRMQLEVDVQRRQIFEERFKKDALEVAKAQAYKDAAEKSGLQKLRAASRARNLTQNNNIPPGSFFEKLRDYTQKNIARREDNLKRTEMMRENAEKIKNERVVNKKIGTRKPFERSPLK